jgi:N,N'-diacetyllegionaminate synthase
VYLGAGGAYLREIEQAIEILKDKEVNVLLGFQSYPTTTEDNQIERVRILKQYLNEKFSNCNVGFADHENPNTPLKHCLSSCAIGAGANIIEKHLTLGKAMLMEDHESALNPDEFLEFTDIMRKCFKGLGVSNISDDFGMSLAEKDYRKMIRRHVVASRDLTIGTLLQPDDVILKRTASEDFITNINDVYSKKLKIAIKGNSAINYSIIQ